MTPKELKLALMDPCKRWKVCKDVRYEAHDYIEALESIIRSHADPTGDQEIVQNLIMGCHNE